MNRRGFLVGLGSVIAAPAVVQADGLMRLRGIPLPTTRWLTMYDICTDQFIDRFDICYGKLLTTGREMVTPVWGQGVWPVQPVRIESLKEYWNEAIATVDHLARQNPGRQYNVNAISETSFNNYISAAIG